MKVRHREVLTFFCIGYLLMMKVRAKDRITELANTTLEDTDFFLIDIRIKGSKNPNISVFIDGSKRSVNLDECAEISNELGFLIDAHEIFDGSYRLNVSSPGLNRPLVDKRQYPKNKGRKVNVKFSDEQEQKEADGMLKEVSENRIIIEKQNEQVTLPFEKIVETRVTPSLK